MPSIRHTARTRSSPLKAETGRGMGRDASDASTACETHPHPALSMKGRVLAAWVMALLVLFVALFCAGLRRVPFSYSLYVAPQLFLLTIRQVGLTPLSSASRYLLVLFPIFIILAFTLREWRYRLWLACSLTLLAAMVALFLLGAFVV